MANEKVITIPLTAAKNHARANRSVKALSELKRQLFKHYRAKPANIRLSAGINQSVWARGREKPPAKLTLRVVPDEDLLRVFLASEKVEEKKTKPAKTKTEKKPQIPLVDEEKKAEDEKKLEEKREKEKMMQTLER